MEKKTLFVLIVVAIIALGVLYVALPKGLGDMGTGLTGASVYREPRPVPKPVMEPVLPVNTVQLVGVDILGKEGFSVTDVQLKIGDSVVWTNKDVSEKKIMVTFQKDQTRDFINSPLLVPGEFYQYTFTEAGTYNFWNLAYAGEGVITVSE